ncbi:MAG: Tol-Pal system protein TolB [Sulfurospirillum sp.]|nr:Tol-Pal system protein TolB [Sulfurospirillum sp.]
MIKKFIMLFVLTCSLVAYDSTVEIVKRMDRLPKIIFQDASSENMQQGFLQKFHKIIAGDLRVSSHFLVDDTYFKSSFDGNLQENFMSETKSDLILRYQLSFQEDENILAKIKLINAKNGQTDFYKIYQISDTQRYPFLAHKIAVDINAYIGAPDIKWMEQFVIFAKYTDAKQSEIVISDYTLSFQKTVLKGGLNIFPKWANKNQDAFYYTSYNGAKPTLFKVYLSSGKRERVYASDGMIVCSDVSKDGNKLLVTMAPQGQTDIFLYDLTSKKMQKLTQYQGIDVGANFIDDDSRIVFVSDRLGYPNIFAKTIGDSSLEQMVYHGKNNNSLSAIENYIVYSSREKESEFGSGTFNLYLISTQTDFIRQLTASGVNLYPRFADDKETILYIKYLKDQSALGVIRLNANKSYHFPLKVGKIQSIDW